MIEDNLKKYLSSRLKSLEEVKERVWQKVENHILYHKVEADESALNLRFSLNMGLRPLAVALVLVILSGTSVSAWDNILPGDRFYSLKQSVREIQLKLVKNESGRDLHIALIEQKAKEVARLEIKAENG